MGESSTSTLLVHRCRFVDYSPAAITALAFPPLPLPSVKGKKKASVAPRRVGELVVGRANGNIELCEWTGSEESVETPQAWVVRKTLAGPCPSKVDSLALAIRYPWKLDQDDVPSLADLRLFSAGGGTELLEWDTVRGEVRRTISSTGGSIWSVAVNPSSSRLALGCEDGSIQILSLENDDLFHLRRLDRSKSRVLSLSWGPVTPRVSSASSAARDSDESDDEDNDAWTDSWLVAGCSDSSLRRYDLASGQILERMGTDKVRGERTLVWTVGVLGDGTIVSGDSLGMVKFWDFQTGTQMQSFQSHGADVLCLAIGSDGTTVYSSGVDQRTVQFSLVKTASAEQSVLSGSRRWVQTASKRMHSHDVRALAVWPPYTPLPPSHRRFMPVDLIPIVVSGGLDMSVAATPAASAQTTTKAKLVNPLATSVITTFEDAYHRRLAYSTGFNGATAVHVARQARLVLCIRDTSVSLWRIPAHEASDEAVQSEEGERTYEEVLEMDLNVRTNLVAGAISGDGAWMAVSDRYEVKLFSLATTVDGDIKPRRIRDFSSVLQNDPATSASGATCITFSPDSSKLVIGDDSSRVLVVELGPESGSPRLLRRFNHHRMEDVLIGDRVVKGRKQGDDVDVDMDDGESLKGATGGDVLTTITRMTISSDGQWLATTDDRRRTHVFNLDALQHHSQLPSFTYAVQAVAFSPLSPALLVLGFANNTLELWDVEARISPAWARQFCSSLPKRFTHLHDPLIDITFPEPSPSLPGHFALIWGSTWLCKVEFSAPTGPGGFNKKRRRQGKQGRANKLPVSENFKLFTQYRQVLIADFVSEKELVVVERPLVDVLARLPPAYFKPKYGAS
ncbi:WD40 repeat-like protein [Peniophora sp. CONT]|nr:WD40 repeat-like protein [Peniophora sp. CONT]